VDQRELVERARGGDHDAFAVLAGAAIPRVDTLARLILRDPELAKDAAQEALVRAWRDLRSLRDPDRFDAWLRRLTVNACTDEARRRHRHRIEVELTPLDHPTARDSALTVDERDALDRGFRRLDPEQRALIVLHHYLDLSLPEVAETMRIPLGTAKSRLHRALAELRAALDADDRTVTELGEGGVA
jgi:RNA polymerase sigma-70 factor, ECF subfamily